MGSESAVVCRICGATPTCNGERNLDACPILQAKTDIHYKELWEMIDELQSENAA